MFLRYFSIVTVLFVFSCAEAMKRTQPENSVQHSNTINMERLAQRVSQRAQQRIEYAARMRTEEKTDGLQSKLAELAAIDEAILALSNSAWQQSSNAQENSAQSSAEVQVQDELIIKLIAAREKFTEANSIIVEVKKSIVDQTANIDIFDQIHVLTEAIDSFKAIFRSNGLINYQTDPRLTAFIRQLAFSVTELLEVVRENKQYLISLIKSGVNPVVLFCNFTLDIAKLNSSLEHFFGKSKIEIFTSEQRLEVIKTLNPQ